MLMSGSVGHMRRKPAGCRKAISRSRGGLGAAKGEAQGRSLTAAGWASAKGVPEMVYVQDELSSLSSSSRLSSALCAFFCSL